MQQPSRKNYFLLALLITILVFVIAGTFSVNFNSFSKNPSVGYDSSRNLNITNSGGAPSPELKMAYGQSVAQTGELVAPGMPIMPPSGDTTPVTATNRKIIKNGNVSVVVKDVDETTKSIEKKAKELGGYLSSTNINSAGKSSKSGYVSARIPVERVNDFLTFLRTSSVKVTSENINSDDVTSEYIDLQAKITNLEATSAQYRELLKRASKVDEVLQVQRELTSVQSQIDSYKGQLKYLEGNSALSNITVNLALDESELPIQPENQWEPGNVFKASVRNLTLLIQNLSYALIAFVVYSVVWIPVLIILALLYKYLKSKIK